MKPIYILSPYSATDPYVMQWRANEAMAFCAWGWRQGMVPLSPIAHWHEAATRCDLPTDAATWISCNAAYFAACGDACLLALPDWQFSKGVALELHWCERDGKRLSVAIPSANGYDVQTDALRWALDRVAI